MGMLDLGIGGLYRGMSSFMRPDRGYRKAQDQLQDYYGQQQGYLQPYQQQGQEAYGHLSGAMQNLLDPQALHNEWAQGYEASPYSQMQQAAATQQGLNAASSMGLMGSTPALQAIQAGTSQIGARDRERYLDSLMQKYLSGAGLAQNIFGTGAQAGSQMAGNAGQMGQNMAQMKFGEQNAPGQMFNDLLKTGAYMFSGGGGR